MKKKLYIVRKEYDGLGGAENVAKRYAETFKGDFDTHLSFAGSEVDRYKFKGGKKRTLTCSTDTATR